MKYVESEFPDASVPAAPILSLSTPGRRYSSSYSVLDLSHTLLSSSCRSAIALALEQLCVSENDEVLVPAYHCASMIDPVRWRKAKPVFYKINRDLSIDLDDIKTNVTERTRVLLLTHYYGFPQDSRAAAFFCKEHNLKLIEDCAHAFYGTVDGLPIGSYGDYAVASSMKFFPICDGGVLASKKEPVELITTEKLTFNIELKFLTNAIDRSVAFDRLKWLRSVQVLKGIILKAMRYLKINKNSDDKQSLPSASFSGFGFDPAWVHKKMSLASKIIMNFGATENQLQQRRSNYLRYLHQFSNVNHVNPVHNDLPENVIPYVFPMYFDYPIDDFIALKNLGVPIIRFGEFLDDKVDSNVCPVSVEYSSNVLQFPCHQELKNKELSWILQSIEKVINSRRNFESK